MNGNFNGFTADKGFLKNVENIELTNDGSTVREFSAKGVEDAETYTLTGNINLKELGDTNARVDLVDRAKEGVTIAYATDVTKGTSDALTLGLSNVGTKGKDSTDYVKVTAAGIEELNVDAKAGSNYVDLSGAADAQNIAVSGAGNVDVKAVGTAVKTFDASAVTGTLKADLTAVTTADQISSVKMAQGGSTVTVDAGDLSVRAEVTGGAGADTLVIKGGSADIKQWELSGVETIKLGALTGDLTYSAKNTADVETIVVTKDTGAVNAKFNGLEDVDMTVQVQGKSAGAGTISLDHSGATTLKIDTPAKAGTVDDNAFNVTLGKSSAVNATVAKDMNYTGTITAAKAESVGLAVKGAVTGATLAAAEATAVTISEVAKTSTLTLTAAKAEELNVTAVAALTITNTADKVQVLNVDTDKAFKVGNLAALSSATLSGLGSVEIGAVGSADLANAVNITAIDLAANTTSTNSVALEVGTITTKNERITFDASDVVGKVQVGAINAGTGNVLVDVDGTAGAVKLSGKVIGEEVTIKATDAVAGVTYGGDIEVGTILNLTGSDTVATDLSGAGGAGEIKATGTSLEANLTTGGLADLIKITAADANNTADIVVKGDLGAGANIVEVSSTETDKAVTIKLDGLNIGSDAGAYTLITGGAKGDTITGTAGQDFIFGGAGADKLTGGDGADYFIFKGWDTAASSTSDTDLGKVIDTIMDFKADDFIVHNTSATAAATATAGLGTSDQQSDATDGDSITAGGAATADNVYLGYVATAAATQDYLIRVEEGVASFYKDANSAASAADFQKMAAADLSLNGILEALDALVTGKAVAFEYDNDTYLWHGNTASNDFNATVTGGDLVVKLAGISADDAAEIIFA